MATKIVVYTKNNCPNCNRAKFMLKHCPVDVELIEINVDNSKDVDKAYENLKSNGIHSLPSFKFENGNIVVGFEEGKIMNELGL
ncbi:TPA: glutaredoxin family protein [Bacillus thuringiensis]|nr:glutaredoxin family protein [Bacillus thuringiensis]